MAKSLDMRIEVPARLRRLLLNPSSAVKQVMQMGAKQSLTLLKTDIVDVVHKKSGALANSVQIDLLGAKVFSKSVYSTAYEKGHWATPKNVKMLHFVDRGKDVFLHSTRSKPHDFFFKTLDKDRLKIHQIYDRVFDRLMENA